MELLQLLTHKPDESPTQSWLVPTGPGISGSLSKSLTVKEKSTVQPEAQYFGIQRVLSSGAKL